MELAIPKLSELQTQPQARELLNAITCDRRAPSYLFAGPPGSGKSTHALSLVRTLFCQGGPSCPGCFNCKQVRSRTHPDLIWVDREYINACQKKGKELKSLIINVDVSRAMGDQLSRTPVSAPLRIAVVPHADQMNADAQNILLKTLEEPPPRAMLVLLAERPANLLATVLSRCRVVRFAPVETADLEEALVRFHGFDRPGAHEAALWSNGDFRQALRYAQPEWRVLRDKVVSDFDKAVSGATRDWLEISLEYEKRKWEFEEEGEDLTDAQSRRRWVQEMMKIYLSLWAKRLQGVLEVPEPLQRLSPGQVAAALNRHLEIMEENLPPRMVLDHLFLTLREGLRSGEVETRSFFDLAVL